VSLSKVWAEVVGGKNPKWPPSANSKTNVSMVWLTLQFNIGFLGFSGSRNSYCISVLQFDRVLTFKSKMAATYSSQFVNFQCCSLQSQIKALIMLNVSARY